MESGGWDWKAREARMSLHSRRDRRSLVNEPAVVAEGCR